MAPKNEMSETYDVTILMGAYYYTSTLLVQVLSSVYEAIAHRAA